MTCKECIHYEACDWFGHIYVEEMADNCLRFKPKSRFIELPCEVGQKVYRTRGNYCGQEIYEGVIDQISIVKDGEFLFWVYGHPLGFTVDDIGKTVFLTKEEAEKALEERNKK